MIRRPPSELRRPSGGSGSGERLLLALAHGLRRTVVDAERRRRGVGVRGEASCR